jgi:hypothetical protein
MHGGPDTPKHVFEENTAFKADSDVFGQVDANGPT